VTLAHSIQNCEENGKKTGLDPRQRFSYSPRLMSTLDEAAKERRVERVKANQS
jgi:hypothetical protein